MAPSFGALESIMDAEIALPGVWAGCGAELEARKPLVKHIWLCILILSVLTALWLPKVCHDPFLCPAV